VTPIYSSDKKASRCARDWNGKPTARYERGLEM